MHSVSELNFGTVLRSEALQYAFGWNEFENERRIYETAVRPAAVPFDQHEYLLHNFRITNLRPAISSASAFSDKLGLAQSRVQGQKF